MTGYLMTLVGASLLVAIVTILSPGRALSGSLRLVCSLFLVAVLLSPLLGILARLEEIGKGEIEFPWEEDAGSRDYGEEMQSALDEASKSYFAELLAKSLESEFEIPTGDVRCEILWGEQNGELRPLEITVLLSGRGIWKDTAAIESYVTALLGCPTKSAIE